MDLDMSYRPYNDHNPIIDTTIPPALLPKPRLSTGVKERRVNRYHERLRFDGKACPYCGRQMLVRGHEEQRPTRDHVVPLCKGGTAILMVCYGCNQRKGDIMPDVFLETLKGCRRTLARFAIISALKEELAK
jgi:5-methylcytosine-specific restriction endonuclease McrA